MSSRILGIDLGTVNSCVAVVEDGRAVILAEGDERIIPSCLAFHRGKEIVGNVAKRQEVTDPHNTVAAVKRLLGHAYESEEVQKARQRVSYAIRPSPLGSVLLEVGGRELTPVQVSARILQRVKEVAEEALGESISKAVISVPAHFNDVQRKATKMAAEYAGLEVVRLLNEPTAAAFAYGYRKGEDFTLAVYDFGGGTFDVTIMTARGDTFEVDATDGDSYLGGEDFDYAIVDWLESEFEAEFSHDLRGDETARLRLKEAAERAKRELSEVDTAQIDLPFLTQLADGARPHFSRTLDRTRFGELARPLIQRTLELCKRCVESSNLVTSDIDEVLLVGGQTRMPQVRDAVRDFFGREPRRDINPDEVVAMGAALFAYSLAADDLKEEAKEAAEEAYAVAYRETLAVKRVLGGVESGAGEDNDALAKRLQALLDEAEAELPSLSAPPPIPSHQLPGAINELQDDLLQIERKVERVLAEAREPEVDPIDERDPRIEQAAERFSRRIASAQEASDNVQAHLAEAEEHASARKVDLIDVTSHALGIASAGDLFSTLIEKNCRVPAQQVRTFTTNQDGQTEVEIRVSQGSSRRASHNQELGNFVLEGIAPAPRMEPKVEVTFRIDDDGILAVSARDAISGIEQGIRVEDPLALRHEDPAQSNEELVEDDTSFG